MFLIITPFIFLYNFLILPDADFFMLTFHFSFVKVFLPMKCNFLFDLDQTLLDFHASERKALEIVLRNNSLPFSDDIYSAFKECNKSLWIKLEKKEISRTDVFMNRFKYIFEKCGGDVSTLDALKVNSDFIKAMSVNGVLLDGSYEFVERLKREIEGCKIYIVSNGATVNAMGRLKSSGLDKFMDGFFISEDMGAAKPDPVFFDIVFERIKQPRESCIVIGDSLSSDMLGAKNASLSSVWFMPEGDVESAMREYDIDFSAGSYDELFYVLKNWANGLGGKA